MCQLYLDLKKNNRKVDLALPDSKSSYKASEIKVVSNNMRLSKHTNRISYKISDPCTWRHMICDKSDIAEKRGKALPLL